MVLTTEIPTPVKVLRYFVENKTKRLTAKEVILAIGEPPERINKALDKMLEKGLIKIEGGFYFYVETSNSKNLTQKLFELYETVKKPKKEDIINDLVIKLFLKPDELEKRLRAEGFNPEEIGDIMENEVGTILANKTNCLGVRLRQ